MKKNAVPTIKQTSNQEQPALTNVDFMKLYYQKVEECAQKDKMYNEVKSECSKKDELLKKERSQKRSLQRLCMRRKKNNLEKTEKIKLLSTKLKAANKQIERKGKLSKAIEQNHLLRECLENSVVHKNARRYKHTKLFATKLRLASPAAYKIVRAENLITMPHLNTTSRWQQKLSIQPGFNVELLHRLERLAPSLSEKERTVTIMIDGMNLKPKIDYQPCSDVFSGWPDEDQNAENLKLAKEAITIMIRSTSSSFKQVCCFIFY